VFEVLRLAGTGERGITLETCRRQRIENAQAPKPGLQDLNFFDLLVSTHGQWAVRKQPCGVYNCFGHVWASRRTAIYDDPELKKILRDDGYRMLSQEAPMPGDVVLYYDPAHTYNWHSGRIIQLHHLLAEHGQAMGNPIPWVLSKLSAVQGEVLHAICDVQSPYDGKFTLEIWTDRP
jgi:hypothetical protein